MNAADRIRLRHMLDAAREALSFAAGRAREDLSSDRMLLLSVIKEIEIIGEAANQVSAEFRKSASEILWARIIGMRNRLIHGYSDVNTGNGMPTLLRWLDGFRRRPSFHSTCWQGAATLPLAVPPLESNIGQGCGAQSRRPR